MNVVTLVGTVTDRPFRPGNGNRTVVKMSTGRGPRTEHFEFDAFGQAGSFAESLWSGDVIAVNGHLENRQFADGSELRIVADFVELAAKATSLGRGRHDRHNDDHDDGDHGDDQDPGDAGPDSDDDDWND